MSRSPTRGRCGSSACRWRRSALTVLVGMALAAVAGANPLAVLGLILKGAAGSRFAALETLNRATPLIFTGLAVAVAFRARLWNIGAEAQLYAGALVDGAARHRRAAAARAAAPAADRARRGARRGAGCCSGRRSLKVRFGVDEVVTTLLLNFIVLLFVSMLLEGPLKDPLSLGWPQSPALVPEARLPRIVPGLRLHWGFVLGLIAAVATWAVMSALDARLRDARGRREPRGGAPSPACRSTRCC